MEDETHPPRRILFGKKTFAEQNKNNGVPGPVLDPSNTIECCYEKCIHCLQAPCVTTNNIERRGSRPPDIRNHSFRHKDYRRYWKFLKDIGLWDMSVYQNTKSAAGLSDDDVRELMPVCVLNDVRKRFPNPPGIPYMGHRRS